MGRSLCYYDKICSKMFCPRRRILHAPALPLMKPPTAHKMGVAALIMAGSIFLSRLMGLVRDKVISWRFGAGTEADVYFAAFTIPDFINYLLAGGYVSITLIPLLSKRFAEDPDDAWRFFSAVLTWAALSVAVLCTAAWLAAPQLAHLTAPGFSPEQLARLSLFLRIILPGQVFFLTGACFAALLYIRKQFIVPALTPLLYNGLIILGGLLWPGHDMEGFCWGVPAGAACGAFALPLAAARAGGLHVTLRLRHPLLKRFVLLALPFMIGQSVVMLDEQFVRVFGSLAGEGAISLLNYSRRIMMVPVGVVAQAAGVASFPFLAALAARNDEPGFNASLNAALRGSLLVVVPLCGLMIALAGPILGFIFEGGSFDATQTPVAAPLLRLMLPAVPFWCVQQLVGRAFYARQDTLTPAVVGTLITLAVLPLYPLLVRTWGASGAALIATLSLIAYTTALLGLWIRRYGSAALTGLCAVLLRSLLATVPAAPAAAAVAAAVPCLLDRLAPDLPPPVMYGAVLTAGTLAFALPWFILARLFLPEVLALIRNKGRAARG